MPNFLFMLLMVATAFLCFQGILQLVPKVAAMSCRYTAPTWRSGMFWLGVALGTVAAFGVVIWHVVYAFLYVVAMVVAVVS